MPVCIHKPLFLLFLSNYQWIEAFLLTVEADGVGADICALLGLLNCVDLDRVLCLGRIHLRTFCLHNGTLDLKWRAVVIHGLILVWGLDCLG